MSRNRHREKQPREIEGIPGTVTHGYKEQPIQRLKIPPDMRQAWVEQGIDIDKISLARFAMGPCNILIGQEPAGANGEVLWHLTISTPSRHPTWDEIKIARYRLLPPELCFALMLPPADMYVNVPEQDHVFQLWEVRDPREPWTTG